MLEGQLEAGEPKEGTHPEDPCPGAGAAMEKTTAAAEVPRQDGNAREMPSLQQQITRLHQELGRQQSLWADVHRKLQSHMDALRKQNRELREELRGLQRQQWEARKKPAASPHAGRESHTLVMHPSSRSPQNSSGRKSPVQASQAATLQKQTAAAGGADRSSSVLGSSEGGFLSRVQADEFASSSPDSAELQVEQALSEGCAITTFPEASQKEPSMDKKTTIIRFSNGDVKKIKPDRRVIYYHANAQTMSTTYPDGLEVVQFPNKQTEKFYPNGSKEIVFPDGTVKHLKDGQEETLFPDGTIVRVERNGDKTIVLSNGQKEIHTAQFKRREYPDGTVKTVYCSGCQETKYASGRVKIKDEAGNVVLDEKQMSPQHAASHGKCQLQIFPKTDKN
ncbi:centromere protein J isoform X3 [Pan troglodytes]|uniref:centromere protein J isoform X3 n=2 Tax=Pan troglodytes TaxID=9598 RepID=UPI0023F43750|nr:centromere protein J isoform X3 [Pan troglodytes]